MSESMFGDESRTRADVKNALIKKQEDMKKSPGVVFETDESQHKKNKKLDNSSSVILET